MVTREEVIKAFKQELAELRQRYEKIVDALENGQVTSQEAREVLYERMLSLEEQMYWLEEMIDYLEEGGELV